MLVFPLKNSQAERSERAERVEMNSLSSEEWSEVIIKYKTLCRTQGKPIFKEGRQREGKVLPSFKYNFLSQSGIFKRGPFHPLISLSRCKPGLSQLFITYYLHSLLLELSTTDVTRIYNIINIIYLQELLIIIIMRKYYYFNFIQM